MNFAKLLIFLSMISASCITYAQDQPPTNIPGLDSVKESDVKGTGIIKVGGKVRHNKFGVGVVKSILLGDGTTTVNIVFKTHGSKWLIAEYANLKVLNE